MKGVRISFKAQNKIDKFQTTISVNLKEMLLIIGVGQGHCLNLF